MIIGAIWHRLPLQWYVQYMQNPEGVNVQQERTNSSAAGALSLQFQGQ